MSWLVPDVAEGELLDETQDCEINYRRFCTNTNVELVEDPFSAEVYNERLLIWACPECLQERADDI